MLPDARALDVPTKPQISGTKVLQNLIPLELAPHFTKPQISGTKNSGTKVLQNLIPLELASHFSQGNGFDFLSVAPAASVFVRLYQ